MVVLFDRQQQDGTSDIYSLSSNNKRVVGNLFVGGSLGSGTLSVQISDGKRWYEISSVTSAPQNISIDQGLQSIKAVLSGSTSPDLDVRLLSDSDADFYKE